MLRRFTMTVEFNSAIVSGFWCFSREASHCVLSSIVTWCSRGRFRRTRKSSGNSGGLQRNVEAIGKVLFSERKEVQPDLTPIHNPRRQSFQLISEPRPRPWVGLQGRVASITVLGPFSFVRSPIWPSDLVLSAGTQTTVAYQLEFRISEP